MLWLKLNKYRSLFSRKLSELTGRTRLHLRRLQWADWVVFNRLAKSHHILEIIRLEKNTQELKSRIPELQLDLLASLVRWWHTRQTFLVTMQPIDYFLASWTSSGSHQSPHWTTAAIFTRQAQTEQKCKNEARHKVKKHVPGPAAGHSKKHKLLQYLQSRLSRCCTSTHRNISKCNASKTDENMIKPFSLWTLWRLYSHSQETPHS